MSEITRWDWRAELQRARDEIAELKAQNDRLVQHIASHHRDFETLHDRAAQEPGEFAAYVWSVTHPDAGLRYEAKAAFDAGDGQ